MALKDDLNAALAAMTPNSGKAQPLNEEGWSQLVVPVPPALAKLTNEQLIVEIVLAGTGKYFTLLTPLAVLKTRPQAAFFEALLYRQFYADQVKAAGFGLSAAGEHDRLVALCHWPLAEITPPQFSRLFQNFVGAALGLIKEVDEMARREPALELIHPAKS